MGVFDGVHRGHVHLLRATIDAARRLGVGSVALVFDPHPEEVIRPGSRVARLTPLDATLDLLRATGADHALPLRFDDELRNLEPEAFLDALAPAIELRALVMTPESAFGRRRAGTLELMRTMGPDRGFEAIEAEPLGDRAGPISSSRVREAVRAGDLAEAARLLDRPPSVYGTLEPGSARLLIAYSPCLPRPGAYAAEVTPRMGDASTSARVTVAHADQVEVKLDTLAEPQAQSVRVDFVEPLAPRS
jgi:riboflavin kinase/FMN adenylyltransferase